MAISNKMLEELRQHRDLDENDTSQDAEILQMSPVKIVKDLTEWHLGDKSWAKVIADWMVKAGAEPEDF